MLSHLFVHVETVELSVVWSADIVDVAECRGERLTASVSDPFLIFPVASCQAEILAMSNCAESIQRIFQDEQNLPRLQQLASEVVVETNLVFMSLQRGHLNSWGEALRLGCDFATLPRQPAKWPISGTTALETPALI